VIGATCVSRWRKKMNSGIKKTAQIYPDRIAIIDGDKHLTYEQLDLLIDGMTATLSRYGIGRGDRVAVLSENSYLFAGLLFAAQCLGFILVPLHRRRTWEQWQNQLESVSCKLILADDEGEQLIRPSQFRIINLTALEKEAQKCPGQVSRSENSDEGDAIIIFTSGSTGNPRAVRLNWRNIETNADGLNKFFPLTENDIWLAPLPFYHIGGLSILYRMATCGGTAIVIRRFNSEEILEIINRRLSDDRSRMRYIISVVPLMLSQMIQHDTDNILKNMGAIILGGSKWDNNLVREIRSRHLPVLTTYGMTETASMITLLNPQDRWDRLDTSGQVLPGREVRIVDEEGLLLAPDQKGRIQVRGPVLFPGYWEEEVGPFDAECWFDTGDLGYLTDDNYLVVTGRRDQVIVSGGENIDLVQIEKALQSLSYIKGAIVVPRPDRIWGQRPIAFVETGSEGGSETQIREDLSHRLDRIATPDRIIVVEKLPLTSLGKYDRPALLKEYERILRETI